MANRKRYITNQQIRGEEFRVIEGKENLGVLKREKAFKLAKEKEKDLILIAPGTKPPVVKLIKLSKYKYQQQQKAQKAKAKSKKQELKEFRLTVSTDDHDMNVRIKRARNFLKKNDKVRFTLRFKGREIVHKELGREKLEGVIKELSDVGKVETPIKRQGFQMSVTLSPD